MQYLLLIYENETNYEGLSPEQMGPIMEAYRAFDEFVRSAGHYLGGNALQPVGTATTVRVRDGKTLTTDGPFAETKEQLGGYYLVDAPDLDAALKIAARIPAALVGSIEVRPIMHFSEDGMPID